jgi:hypothetical protein
LAVLGGAPEAAGTEQAVVDPDEVVELVVGRALCGTLRAVPATGATTHRDHHPGRHGIFFGAAPSREEGGARGGVGVDPAGVARGDATMVGGAPGATGGALPPP